jgi:phosphatidylglycerol:prolipoprotein diacylglycerol transferase
MFKAPADILISLFGVDIYYYGVIMAFACLIGVYSSYFIYKKIFPKNDSDRIIDCATWILVFGILGARIYYCMLNPVYYLSQPTEIFNIRQGGMSIHGALILGGVTLIYFANRYKLGGLKLLDAFACGTALAQSLGRWGNFFNSEAFGYPTNLPWKLYIPYSKRPDIYRDYDYFHPTFLYESILDFLMFVILLLLIKKYGQKYNGLVTFMYLILYSIIRFFVESFRTDSALNISQIPIAQIVSGILFVLGIFGLLWIKNKHSKKDNLV